MTSQPFNLERSFQDAQPGTPIFVFLSPGVDVAGSVEALGRKMGFTAENGRYFSVSLGQGQVRATLLVCMWCLVKGISWVVDWVSWHAS